MAKASVWGIVASALLSGACTAERAYEPDQLGAQSATDCRGLWHIDRETFVRNAPEALAMIDRTPVALDRFTGRVGLVTFDEVPSTTCTIRALREGEAEAVAPIHSGEYSTASGDITLVIDRIPRCAGAADSDRSRCTGSVLLHEILHGFGVGHVRDDEQGIMHPTVIAPFFTKADWRVCREAGVCD